MERGGRRGRGRKQEAVEPVKQFPFPAPPHTAQQHSAPGELKKWRVVCSVVCSTVDICGVRVHPFTVSLPSSHEVPPVTCSHYRYRMSVHSAAESSSMMLDAGPVLVSDNSNCTLSTVAGAGAPVE